MIFGLILKLFRSAAKTQCSTASGSSRSRCRAGPQLVEAVKVALGSTKALPRVRWAPLPPRSLQNSVPDGGWLAGPPDLWLGNTRDPYRLLFPSR